MDVHQLKEQFIEDHHITELHSLHNLVLDECCESALRQPHQDYTSLSVAVSVGFLTCISGLRGIVEDGLKEYDQVKVIYRGSPFVFTTTEDPALTSAGLNLIRHQN